MFIELLHLLVRTTVLIYTIHIYVMKHVLFFFFFYQTGILGVSAAAWNFIGLDKIHQNAFEKVKYWLCSKSLHYTTRKRKWNIL